MSRNSYASHLGSDFQSPIRTIAEKNADVRRKNETQSARKTEKTFAFHADSSRGFVAFSLR
jgi:hypothetical protein